MVKLNSKANKKQNGNKATKKLDFITALVKLCDTVLNLFDKS